MAHKFNYPESLKIALRSTVLTNRMGLRAYADIVERDDILVLKESKVDLLFATVGKYHVVLININCQGKTVKMKVIKTSKSDIEKISKFMQKGGKYED